MLEQQFIRMDQTYNKVICCNFRFVVVVTAFTIFIAGGQKPQSDTSLLSNSSIISCNSRALRRRQSLSGPVFYIVAPSSSYYVQLFSLHQY